MTGQWRELENGTKALIVLGLFIKLRTLFQNIFYQYCSQHLLKVVRQVFWLSKKTYVNLITVTTKLGLSGLNLYVCCSRNGVHTKTQCRMSYNIEQLNIQIFRFSRQHT